MSEKADHSLLEKLNKAGYKSTKKILEEEIGVLAKKTKI